MSSKISSLLSIKFSIVVLALMIIGEQSAAFSISGGFRGTANNAINVLAKQPDGRVIVAGDFVQIAGVTQSTLARLLNDGSVDPTFQAPTIDTTSVFDIAVQQDGKLILVGNFSMVGGVSRANIVRLMSDGAVDTSFDTTAAVGSNGLINTVAIQKDGKILIGGAFTAYSGQARNRFARLNSDGTLDSSFNLGADTTVSSVTIADDGRIAVVGSFVTFGGQASGGLAVLKENGQLDSTFDVGTGIGSPYATQAVFQRDGKLIVAGGFNSYRNDTNHRRLLRLNLDGSVDTSYQGNGSVTGIPRSISLFKDGRLGVVGDFSSIGGLNRNSVAVLLPNGAADPSFQTFGVGFSSSINLRTILEQDDGEILIGGLFTSTSGGNNLTRVSATGRFDRAIVTTFNNRVNALAQQPDGKVLVGGTFMGKIARLNTDGQIDAGFSPVTFSSTAQIRAISVQPDGKIMVGGSFLVTSTLGNKQGIARLNADGSLDPSFSNSGILPGQQIRSISLQPDGKMLVAGEFSSMNGVSASNMVRLNSDGSLDTSFANQSFSGIVFVTHVQPDGKILVGGAFTQHNGAAADYIVRLMPDGTRDSSFVGGTNNNVFSIATLPDGNILIGGGFTRYAGSIAPRIVRVSDSGTIDTSFDGTLSGATYSISVTADGNAFVVGDFLTAASNSSTGFPTSRVAKFDPNGIPDADFVASATTNDSVLSSLIREDGVYFAGGWFTIFDGVSRLRYVRISHPDVPPSNSVSYDAQSRTVTYSRGGSAPLLNWVQLQTSQDGNNWSDPILGVRAAGNWDFGNVKLEGETLNYFRFRGTHGSSGTNGGSMLEKIFEVYNGKTLEECSFFIVATKTGSSAIVCL